MLSFALCASVILGQLPSGVERFSVSPLHLRASEQGAAAVFFDPAGGLDVDAHELHGNFRFNLDGQSERRLALSSVFTYEFLRGGIAFEHHHTGVDNRYRASFVLGAKLWDRLVLGVAYRRHFGQRKGDQWDLGVHYEPHRVLALNLTLEHLGADGNLGGYALRALRSGVALRPIAGSDIVTVGFETRWLKAGTDGRPSDSLLGLTLRPHRTFGIKASYEFSSQNLWVGLDFRLFSANGVSASFETSAGARTSGLFDVEEMVVGTTVRMNDRNAMIRVPEKTIELQWYGNLKKGSPNILAGAETISRVLFEAQRVADAKDVKRVLIKLGTLKCSLAEVEGLRRAIVELKERGKKVEVFLNSADEKTYMVAAAADRIVMDPMGVLTMDGFSAGRLFFGDTLRMLGIDVDVISVGDFKTGGDSFSRGSARPNEVLVRQEIIDNAYQKFVGVLRRDRNLSSASIQDILRRGGVTAPEAKALNLVDDFTQPLSPKEKMKAVARGASAQKLREQKRSFGLGSEIRVIPIVGTMVRQSGGSILGGEESSSLWVAREIRRAVANRRVRAIVLRIESPGGAVQAAEDIWREVKRAKEHKAVVVSMGSVAASGGYYAAAPAHKIIAEASTLTGSIGIYTAVPKAGEFFKRLKIGSSRQKRGPHADWKELDVDLSPEARARLEHVLGYYYEQFVARVAEGRKLGIDEAEKLAGGRVYTGARALELGLVDGIGGLPEAIEEAAMLSGLHGVDYDTKIVDEPVDIVGNLGDALGIPELPSISAMLTPEGFEKVRNFLTQPLAMLWFFSKVEP